MIFVISGHSSDQVAMASGGNFVMIDMSSKKLEGMQDFFYVFYANGYYGFAIDRED